jgi:2-polyprenyl-6-methoxyphenol hydroxylase-like FAD-dependent oxidoreductase
MMLGYLLGRADVDVVVLEKHADFFRDFRGDTVHPSTLQVMDELGLIDGFLRLPHQRLQKMDGLFGGTPVRIADLRRLHIKYPFIAFMPQWDFLNFLREAGQRFGSLKVMMSTDAVDLIRRGETIAGVRARTAEGPIDIEADLTVACDGRHSTVRACAGLDVEEIGAPMDVLWFRAGRKPDETENVFARVEAGKMMVTFDRGDYWQCAYVIAKGQYDAVRARGLQALLDDVARMAPLLKSGISDVRALMTSSCSPSRSTAWRGGPGRACSASEMPRMRCRRSAASASISPSKMPSRPPTCSPTSFSAVARPSTSSTPCAVAAPSR